MAKRRPIFPLEMMEKELGFKAESLAHSSCKHEDAIRLFYSDLSPVSNSPLERTAKEFESYQMRKALRTSNKCGQPLTRQIPRSEKRRLPRELRQIVYNFTIPTTKYKLPGPEGAEGVNLAHTMADAQGFYFPHRPDLALLRVNRQMREEALPLAYRKTTLQLEDVSEAVKILIAIGTIGRENIEVLEISWDSRECLECGIDSNAPSQDKILWGLPQLHVGSLVKLLQQCRRLCMLRVCFEEELIREIPPGDFKSDLGINGLASVRGLEKVEFGDRDGEPLGHCGLLDWLNGAMTQPRVELTELNEL
ncbi:uncharacterized protein BCR38DRAFT_329991 [Pseudomassariella vexata]|uniref:Uncharacterized protein n=1 Tax=Pseudomassariella vexata TaxID=1141098 RepID=A0A1Y2ELG6_9PEZI|nr:uncharacterized protein BCR38DRAFT_329991 [Pseudomassariella vexata]ORY72144.1 hypothetical protein BCR38DRAFT_329991 [Pseudomassariella vexata]